MDEQHVEHFVEFAAGRGIDTAQVWLAVRSAEPSARDGAVIHAASCHRQPRPHDVLLGGSARLNPRQCRIDRPRRQLIEAVRLAFRRQESPIHLVLLDPSDEPARRLYERHDFVGSPTCSTCRRRRGAVPPAPAARLLHVAPLLDAVARALRPARSRGTYEGEPGLPLAQRAAGHGGRRRRPQGQRGFEPGLWTLLLERGEPLGVLLCSPHPRVGHNGTGLPWPRPAARGRGVADLMVRHALATTAAAGVSRSSLAVDADNVPALRLYPPRPPLTSPASWP